MDEPVSYGSLKYPEQPVNLPSNRNTKQNMVRTRWRIRYRIWVLNMYFHLPGSSFRGLHDSLVNHNRNQEPEMIMGTHEAIVLAMAHGYAKASGQTALAIVHDLVGLMTGSVGVYDIWCDRVPVLILGGSGPHDPARRRYIDWAHTASMQSDLVKPFCKWTHETANIESLHSTPFLKANKLSSTVPKRPDLCLY